MKRFDSKRIADCLQYAADGGQALQVWQGCWPDPKPRCFVNGKDWGHLLDQNVTRLITTAQRLGVKRVKVSSWGSRTQHIDLCGKPLERAMKECEP